MLAAILLLAAPNDAMAWDHMGRVWSRDHIPLEWWMSDYIEDSITETFQVETLQQSFDNWGEEGAAPCAQLSNTYMGVRKGHHVQGLSNDRLNTMYFDDPTEAAGGGILGFALTSSTGEIAFSRNGISYYYVADSDIVFGKDLIWVSSDEAQDAQCSGSYSLEAVATHEIGHVYGMGHTCEEDDVNSGNCDGDELFEAIMFWSLDQCEHKPLNEDDVEGITALYGPYAEFAPTTATRGGVPLEVCFDLSSNSAITEAEWSYGDGTTETLTDTELCHEYTTQGQYTVNVTIRGESDDCGEWEYTERERALVVVCEPPQAAEGFSGLFSYDELPSEDNPDNGTVRVQMINQADTTTYGCIEQAQWDVFKGDTLVQSAKAWAPKLDLDEDSTYRIVLNLAGPGGIYAEALTIETGAASGCSALGSGAALSGALLGLLAVGYRRERR